MIYMDYKVDQITKEGKENLIRVISNILKFDNEIIIKYIDIYKEYPNITFYDIDGSDYD